MYPNYQTVLFDLDGTLLNTIEDLAAAGNHVCRDNGWPEYPVDRFQALVGHGIRNLVSRLPPEARRAEAEADLERNLARFSAYYAAHAMDRTVPYPGIPELLDRLRGAGMRLAVCSNKDDRFSVELVERYFPGRFALVRGKRDGVPVKPDPAIVQGMLSDLGASAAGAVFVGDSAVDIRTGHNAGLPACGVTWGFRSRASLAEAGADFLADTPAQLEGILLGGGT